MLQRHSDTNRPRRRNIFREFQGDLGFGLRQQESPDGAQRSLVDYHRQRAHDHLAGESDEMRGIGLGRILAILGQSGKSSDGQEQQHYADLQIDA